MAYTVGPKGQVVIAKEIRAKLGVKPRWVALQRIVDDHIEVYFVPPEHRESLKGSLAKYLKAHIGESAEEWDKALETAREAEVAERAENWGTSLRTTCWRLSRSVLREPAECELCLFGQQLDSQLEGWPSFGFCKARPNTGLAYSPSHYALGAASTMGWARIHKLTIV